MKKLLIIRSVSFQQLDLNLPEIKKRFPDYEISLLTHAHGVALAEKYQDIAKVYVYDYTGGFSVKNKVLDLEGKSFDALLVPVTNLTGCGFLNVLAFGTKIKSREYYMCNVVSEITKTGRAKVFWKRCLEGIQKVLAFLLAIPCAVIGIGGLLINLKGMKKSS